MFQRFRPHASFPTITATAALLLVFAAAGKLTRPVQAVTANGTWFLGGTFSDLPACSQCEISLSPSGESTMGSTQNTSNEVLSPSVPIVASKLSVHLETAPGSGIRTVAIFSHNDSAHNLSCDITGTSTTCSSGVKTLTIAPNTPFFIDVVNQRNSPPTKLQFSWLATPQ